MTGNRGAASPRLWVSYPWVCREEGDFAGLVPQLKRAGIDATYDSLELKPDTRMVERIVQRLLSIDFDGWLYVLTHQLLTHKSCADDLVAAVNQAIVQIGPEFPMIGLLHGVAAQQVPPALRLRPCVSVADPHWGDQVSKAMRPRSSPKTAEAGPQETQFAWKAHVGYGGDPSMTAIEVGSKLESVPYWRFAIPKTARVTKWGPGPAGGGEICPHKFGVTRGSGKYGSFDVVWFGAANAISPTESAYIVFSGPLPDFVCFGPALSPNGPPQQMEIRWASLANRSNWR